jgi:cytochrome c oxidase assembly factor CtaG
MPPLTPSNALTTWQFAPLVSAGLAALAIGYLACMRAVARRRRPGARPWPAARALSFSAGLAAIAVATQGSPGVYDETLLSAHMVQHLLLIMVAPPLLMAGRPVTLLLHAARNPWHTRVKRVVRSRAAAALTWPPFGVMFYSVVVLATHLTSLIAARGAMHDAEHVCYLVAGYLYFLPIIGSEPIRWRTPIPARYLLLAAATPADIVVGAVLMMHGPLYGYGAADVRHAGVIMLTGSDIVMTGVAAILAAAMVSARSRQPARPAEAADLTAYNAYLASLDKSK